MAFPNYRQLDSMDCGSTCLRIIAKHYGKSISIQHLREICSITREGISMLGISDAAEKIGFHTIGAILTWQQLCDEVKLPCIVHWNQKHFVVVYKIKKDKVYVSDPEFGLLEYTKTDFLKCWLSCKNETMQNCGIALIIEPTPFFYEEDEACSKINVFFFLHYLKPHKSSVKQVFLCLLVGSILNVILPFVSQSIVDEGISLGNLDFVIVLLIAQIAIVFGQMTNNFVRSWLMLYMTSCLSISLISDFLAKLMRLPISFFDSKMIGDIMQRIGDHNRIQTFLTESLLSIIISAITFIVYGLIIAGYNMSIMLVFVIGSISYILWVLLFVRYRKKLDYMRFQVSSSNQSNLIQLVTGMQDIKLNNCEKHKRWEWERIQVKLFKINIKCLNLGQVQNIGGTFIDQIKNIIITYLTAKAVIDGNMTLGMLTAVQYVIGQLNAPISLFISFFQSYQDASISLERLNEIHTKDDEEPIGNNKITNIPDNSEIELKNVTFQYDGPFSEKVVNNISMVIPSNKVTAIVGSSGSGKTTLLKLMLGFYEPVEGEILLNGKKLSMYSDSKWRSKCGVVMQEGFIFSDTIENNITMWNEEQNEVRLQDAIETANIDNLIADLPLGLSTKIGIDGHGLSSGQKQRILIARAAYKNAPFLFLDEATNSLDANNERIIMNNLQSLFKNKTVIVVAHRLSTVKNADTIVVIEKGKIVETGNHTDLIKKKGNYYQLVKNQLELGN